MYPRTDCIYLLSKVRIEEIQRVYVWHVVGHTPDIIASLVNFIEKRI